MSNPDFAGEDYEFVAGSLHGLRSWGLDKYGRLHGVTHAEVWLPGENVAVCKQTKTIACPNAVAPKDHLPRLSDAAVDGPTKKRRGRKAESDDWTIRVEWEYDPAKHRCGEPTCYDGRHTVGLGHRFDPNCQCGFWAYDEVGFSSHGKVVGVVEGYGKTTVGTKGFRCEKARIVGLCRGEGESALARSEQDRLAFLYPDVQWFDSLNDLTVTFDVARSWPEVDDQFWLRPVPGTDDAYQRAISFGGRRVSRASLWTNPAGYSLGGTV